MTDLNNMVNKIYLKDYQAPHYFITHIDLMFTLDAEKTKVESTLHINANPSIKESVNKTLILNGSDHHLLQLSLSDKEGILLDLTGYLSEQSSTQLVFKNLPEECIIKIENLLNPSNNKALEGLYLSNDIFCTDCEPQGFRKITYFQDRPDNMATYHVKIVADQRYACLLSNGNLIESGLLDNNQHYAIWHDPFPKPSYLFALIAGKLSYLEDHHQRPDTSKVTLRVYSDQKVINQCHFALESLKKAFEWDEERFGLACDLDTYNIVAIDDFNGGAMENKGLNIFNTKYVLAEANTATDQDFEGVESVIAHEYFHNWTGNRVTCRDWFQLSLKEGLTVFRDQEFSADQHHSGLQRIKDVKRLKLHQFPEDAGKLSHPVRPEEYIEIKNFYTTTVYEKGAEVVRLYQTLLGKAGFRAGMDLYFQHFDGMAVTCEDFLQCMRDANQNNKNGKLPYFERWYQQSGTPIVRVTTRFDAKNNRYQLKFEQLLKDQHKPQLIPIKLALLDKTTGAEIINDLVILDDQVKIVHYKVDRMPIPSLLREFSAPVILKYAYTFEDLFFLAKYDRDHFNRFEVVQQFVTNTLLQIANKTEETECSKAMNRLFELFELLLNETPSSPEFFVLLLKFPEQSSLVEAQIQEQGLAEPIKLHQWKQTIIQALANRFKAKWLEIYFNCCDSLAKQANYFEGAGERALKNVALDYLSLLPEEQIKSSLMEDQYNQASNMTDRLAALKGLLFNHPAKGQVLLTDFYQTFKSLPLIVDQWFSLQASLYEIDLLTLNQLVNHEEFNFTNPNRVRALLGVIGGNLVFLHQHPKEHYQWLAEQILKLDAINPQTASRLAKPLTDGHKFKPEITQIIQTIVNKILSNKEQKLSKNLFEQLSRCI